MINEERQRRSADKVAECFFSLSINLANNIYEKFHRLRAAADMVESMYNNGVINRYLCVALETRINNKFAQEMIENDKTNRE